MRANEIYAAALAADVLLYLKGDSLAYKAAAGVPAELRGLIGTHKDALIAYLRERGARGAEQAPAAGMQPLADRRRLPLSRAQRRMWFADRQSGDGSQFNIQGSFEFDGRFDAAAFRQALRQQLERHEVLRCNFFEQDGELHARAVARDALPLVELDLGAEDAARQADSVRAAIRQDLRRRFDLAADPLFRVTLLRLAAERHVAIFNMHHIVSDGWSVGLLIEQFCAAYAAACGHAAPLPPPALQYADYAAWQDAHLQGEVLAKGLAFWKDTLAGAPAVHGLPLDKPRPAQPDHAGERHASLIAPPLAQRIQAYCQARKVTLFMFLETAFALAMGLYGDEHDIVVGTPVAGRTTLESESLIGLFINTVALRNRLDPAQSFDALLQRNKQQILDGFAQQHIPFEQLVEELGQRRSSSYSPLFQLWFVLQNNREVAFALPGCSVRALAEPPAPAAKYELNLYATEGADGIALDWVFRRELFDAAAIRYVADQFLELLAAVVDAPERACFAHAVFRAPAARIAPPAPAVADIICAPQQLLRRLAERCASCAARPAVVTGEASHSYAELQQLSRRYVQAIQSGGTQGAIGLLLERGVDIVAAMLAALQLGRPYVSLDPAYPQARLHYMAGHAGCGLLISSAAHADLARTIAGEAQLLLQPAAAAGDEAIAVQATDAPAYILYTSGSTGQPKGVYQSHANLAYHAESYVQELGLTAEDRILQLASYNFDASVLDTYGALLAGASVHLADARASSREQLLRQIAAQGISVYHSTPTLFKYLFADAAPEPLAQVRLVVLGGEAVDAQTRKVFAGVFGPHCRLVGLYGATESSLTTLNSLPRAAVDAGLPPNLGYAIPATEILVRRADGSPARVFETGQIVIRSAHLACGYWQDPALTAQRFLDAGDGRREYLSGDTGYLLPDGSLRFVGRQDFQVKLNGIRIELGEIESTLRECAGVSQAAVIIAGDEGDHHLVAYLAVDGLAPGDAARERELAGQYRARLRQWLPDYMVPGIFVFQPALPLTPSGKVDRRNLPRPQPAAAASLAPRNAAEQRTAAVWQRVLGCEAIDMRADFFALGGHSLKALRLLAALREEFGVEIPLRRFFEQPTVEACAQLLAHPAAASAPEQLPQLAADSARRHEPFPLTLLQQAYWLGRSDVFELGNGSTQSYIEVAVQALDVARLEQAFARLIARHDMLRAVISPAGEQRILAQVPHYAIAVQDLRAADPAQIAAATEALRENMAGQVLPLHTWPIFDLRASLLPGGEGRLHVVTDAITLDARSRAVLAAEFAALYRDPALELAPLALCYRDYVLAQQQRRESAAYAAARDYWLQRLDALPGAPELPLLTTPGAGSGVRRWQLALDAAQWERLKSRASAQQLTPANVVLTAFAETLARWSKSGHFCLNLTLFDRQPLHAQVNDIAGDFTSSLLLEVNLDAAGDFTRQARRVQQQLWSDIEQRHFSGVEVLRELNNRRGTRLTAQMPVVFTSTLGLGEAISVAAEDPLFVVSDAAGAGRSRTSQVYLDCQLAERKGGAQIVWNGVEALFPAGLLGDMFDAFAARLQQIVCAGAVGLPDDRPGLPPRHAAVRAAANATAVAREPGVLLHQLFAAQVALRPRHTALVTREQRFSYAELDQLSTALAHQLRQHGVKVNELVAVAAGKGWEQVVGVLAVLKAGAAYLPLDPELPAQRRAQLLAQAEVRVALTQPWLDAALEWPQGLVRIGLERERLAAGEMRALDTRQSDTDLAYVIFTSGSTGVPKGVMIDHRGAVNTVLDINARFGVDENDAVLALSALNFDLSVYDIFGLLAAGGCIVMPDPASERDPLAWSSLVESHRVTVWNTVPALARMWLESLQDQAAAPVQGVRVVMMSGDWIPTDLPARLRRQLPAAQLYSLGGATEVSIWSIIYPIGDVDPAWSSIPYGKPMENQYFRVLGRGWRDCPEWVPGDLYIGGVGLAHGYWKDAVKTEASFVTDPHTGERLYRTGDLGRYLPDGNIEFLGREDNQVKVNGYRIELGDIETAMLAHPEIRTAIAAAVGERNRRQLVAYVQLRDAARQQQLRADRAALDALSAEVQQLLRERLPAYMMPAAFVLIDAVPLSANGKVDRKALPAVELQREARREYRAPADAVESAVCTMWQQLLSLPQVGAEDNFFEIGGDSLLASRAVGLIRNHYGLGEQFRIRSFFENPTVQAVAAQVSALLQQRSLQQALRQLDDAQAEVEEGLL
ncbi:non-ribosomal peptide synthetase [Tahibacter harae]|uniref:Amino acid adenylation domain-containing protein n=1 Tax=Tahibacter harae TaxID=2963937 RepID=A0ABT1QP11_9GAMM|nr:non-ribosomal peptide synthetase [Tahibacter harae]MCQ4163607.1 amino acid adenylation domain-containing protein [Tahibacter harae]